MISEMTKQAWVNKWMGFKASIYFLFRRKPRTVTRWTRWWKHLLGIDPLVGMYFVTYVNDGADPSWGQVVGRVETGNKPKYLLRYFVPEAQGPADVTYLADLWGPDGRDWCPFYETKKEAQRWWMHRLRIAERDRISMRQTVKHPAPACSPPESGRPN